MRYEVRRIGPGLSTEYVEAAGVRFVEGWVAFVKGGVVIIAFPERTVLSVTLISDIAEQD
jgi:hypothetical protein